MIGRQIEDVVRQYGFEKKSQSWTRSGIETPPFFASRSFLLGDDSTKVKVPESDNVSILKKMVKLVTWLTSTLQIGEQIKSDYIRSLTRQYL